MKIYLNRQQINGPWGGGAHFINAFYKFAPNHGIQMITASNIAPDVIVVAGLDADDNGVSAESAILYKSMMSSQNKDVKIVLRVNENDARKGTNYVDDYLLSLAPHFDGTVWVSHWLKSYFEQKGWSTKNSCVIHNGVDGDIFKPYEKLNNGRVNIVAHHWSDNPLKGFDIYEKIDEFVGQHSDKFCFTYIGRHRGTFKNTTLVRPLSGAKLGEELGRHDVYVSASRFDPGPNHISEAISCGLPTYVCDQGGGCVEFAGSDHSYCDWDALQKILISGNFTSNSTSFTSWAECINKYVKFINQI